MTILAHRIFQIGFSNSIAVLLEQLAPLIDNSKDTGSVLVSRAIAAAEAQLAYKPEKGGK
jgi:hypothetical protein